MQSNSEKKRLLTRRRSVMVVILCVASLFLVGLSQQQTVERALAIGESLHEAVRSSIQKSVAVFQQEVRVGIQVGHLEAQNQPEELEKLRYSTGGQAGDIFEVDVNYNVALMLKDMLEAEGISVDLLPATVTANYRADLFLAIHSDSSSDARRRGYKSAYFKTPRNDWEPLLKRYLDENYFYFTGLPDDDENVSGSMLEYYAFNKRYKHAVSSQTPAVIVELGYISNQDDLQVIEDPVQPAYALKMGILAYLKDRGRLPQ